MTDHPTPSEQDRARDLLDSLNYWLPMQRADGDDDGDDDTAKMAQALAQARAQGEHAYLDQLSDLRARLWAALRPNLEPDGTGSDDALVDRATRLWCHHAEAQGHEEQARREGVAQGQQDERAKAQQEVAKVKARRDTAYGYGSDAGKPPWM